MSKRVIVILVIICILGLTVTACNQQKATIVETIDGFNTYYKMSDGTWKCNDVTYKYRLEISGRMPNAAKDSTFVYLSNLEEITFDQAWKAAGLSSDLNDYFAPNDAILVELN